MIFTDDKEALREAVRHDHERLTATEVFRPRKQPGQERLKQLMRRTRQFYEDLDRTAGQAGQSRTASQKEFTHER